MLPGHSFSSVTHLWLIFQRPFWQDSSFTYWSSQPYPVWIFITSIASPPARRDVHRILLPAPCKQNELLLLSSCLFKDKSSFHVAEWVYLACLFASLLFWTSQETSCCLLQHGARFNKCGTINGCQIDTFWVKIHLSDIKTRAWIQAYTRIIQAWTFSYSRPLHTVARRDVSTFRATLWNKIKLRISQALLHVWVSTTAH